MEFNIGKMIKESREKNNLSMRKLSELSDISYAEISRIESGKNTSPKLTTIKKICRYIDLNFGDILYALGLGATYNKNNMVLIKYYLSLTGDNLKKAILSLKGQIKMNNEIIESLKIKLKDNKNIDLIVDTIKSLQYENTTNNFLREILEEKVVEEFLKS